MNKQKIIEKYKRSSGMEQDRLGHGYHSGSYHRHFEDYAEFEALDDKGRSCVKRVYTGVYYTPELDGRQRALVKLIYIGLWLFAGAVLGFFATRAIGANSSWYCALGQLGIIIGLFWTAIGLFNYLTSPLKRTVGDWRSSSGNIKSGSICTAAFFLLEAMLNLLYFLLRVDALGMQLLCSAGYLLGAAAMVLLNRIETNAPYTQTPSNAQAPNDAAIID